MNLFTKTKKENLSKEQETEYKRLIVEIDKTQIDFDNAPMRTKEKGDLLLKLIDLFTKKYKIKSTWKERQALKTLKLLYKTGRGYGKWK